MYRQTLLIDPSSPQAKGLVGFWPLNDGGGTVARDSAGSNHGAMANFPSNPWISSPLGNGLQFDGSNDIITSANNSPITGAEPRSFSFWVWFNWETGRQTLFSMGASGDGSQFAPETNGYYGSPRNIYVNCWNYDTYTTTKIPLRTWTHVAIIYSGGNINPNMKIYFNGINQTVSYNINGTLNTSASKIWIGRDRVNNRQPYNGGLADLRMYNRALSASEVQNIYVNPKGIYQKRSIVFSMSTQTEVVRRMRMLMGIGL